MSVRGDGETVLSKIAQVCLNCLWNFFHVIFAYHFAIIVDQAPNCKFDTLAFEMINETVPFSQCFTHSML